MDKKTKTMTTLGAVFDRESWDPVLNRIKEMASVSLPLGWRDWVLDETSLKKEYPKQTLEIVVFALSMTVIDKGFNPDGPPNLKMNPYRITKMMSWPFCRGLVISPSKLSKEIRGSESQHERVLRDIAPFKHIYDQHSDLELKNGQGTPLKDTQKRRANSPLAGTSKTVKSSNKMDGFTFKPNTKVKDIECEEDEEIQKQGAECLRLGTDEWINVSYHDAKKKLEAGGVFGTIKKNPQLTYKWPESVPAMYEDLDETFGIIQHGLLLQRKQFELMVKKFPQFIPEINMVYSPTNSSFKAITDNLLQYVCGKRLNFLYKRRTLIKKENAKMGEMLRDIPPTTTFLYDEKKLEDALKKFSNIRDMPSTSSRYHGQPHNSNQHVEPYYNDYFNCPRQNESNRNRH